MNAKYRQTLSLGLATIIVILSLACQGLSRPTQGIPSEPEITEPAIGEEPEIIEEPEPTEKPSLSPVTAKTGELIQSGDLVLFVVGWEDVLPTAYHKPGAGNKFVAVEYIAVNAGSIPLPLSCYSDIYLKDESGQMYEQDIGATLAADISSLSIELNPGEKVRGKTGYQVPQNATGLQFIFDSRNWNAAKVFVNLGPTPVSSEAPSTLPAEKPQASHKVGETVIFGSLAITVNSVTYPAPLDYAKPLAGHKFLAVDITIENKGSTSAEIYTGQMAILDALGWFFDEDINATMAAGGKPLTINLAQGEKIRTQVGFQIPEQATGLIFIFDNNNYEEGRVTISLP